MSFIKESKSSYFFEWQKSKHAKGGQSSKIDFFLSKRDKARLKSPQSEARFQRKTTPFRIHNSVFMGLLQFIENLFAILNNNVASAHCVQIAKVIQGVKTPCCSGYAFSCALKNKFEIISRNENYAFDYNKYFCRNGNNRKNDLFSRNDYGGTFIFGFWNNFNFGFLFNRKIKKINLCQRFSVGEGEQK